MLLQSAVDRCKGWSREWEEIVARLRLEQIQELPSEEHPFFLLPERQVVVSLPETRAPLTMAYREAGSGKPVLLLHGLWTSAYTFRSLVRPLSDRCRLIMPELVDPRGQNLLPDLDYRPQRLADLVLAIAQALKLEKPVVVAHAESALAGMWLALQHPECMSALVTLGMAIQLPVFLKFKRWLMGPDRIMEKWANRGFQKPQMAAIGMLDYADPAVICRQEIRLLSRYWSTWPGAKTMAKILSETLNSAYRQEVMRALSEHVLAGKTFTVPLKLVYGDSDRRAPLEHGRRLNRLIPGSEFLVAEQSAGMMQVERPEWLASVIASAAQA
jgi:pimeloyl-ACP methyl ester carboxylesterase